MTKVTYVVNGIETASYSDALILKEKTGQPLIRRYKPIYSLEEDSHQLTEREKELRDKRIAFRNAKRKGC